MKTWTRLLFCATALTAVCATPAMAAGLDEPIAFNIAPGSLDEALIAYSSQADLQVISASNAVRGKQTRGVEGATTPREALAMLLQDSGLTFVATSPSTVTVTQGEQEAGGSSADATVEALIVTAQKREENIQDVPIAISAFTSKDLAEQKIEGGFDLLKAIPNVSFSKNNFTSYNFSIRGIGTKAISATTDPGVAVSFNNMALIQNRLFEQEYFDVERVEVLRGPQGTLYGRNATAGVINVISAKPDMDGFDGWLKGEVGNYDTKRISAMVNVPLVKDRLAIRLAGALTDRQGYDFNSLTGNAVNGRDLWSARITVGFNPTDSIRANLIWERFEEDDNRSRTGKQLCHRDAGPSEIGGVPVVPEGTGPRGALIYGALFSQGCKPGNLYDDAAFGTPNGLANSLIFAMAALGNENDGVGGLGYSSVGWDEELEEYVGIIETRDPYASKTQSPDLRVIESIRDPRYRAKADVVELNVDVDLGEALTFYSQTVYNKDTVYSFQDFNRFNTQPLFKDTSNLKFRQGYEHLPSGWVDLAPGGVFCDPQLGCTDRLVGFDISQAKGEQIGQEFRLQSSFDGPVNFSVGANYTRFEALVDYYVFYNLMTAFAQIVPFNGFDPGQELDNTICNLGPGFLGDPGENFPTTHPRSKCPYIDPNPIESINGEGHNYFRSKNPYKLKSAAAFGEVYWQATDALKVTAGLRYTDDKKTFIPVPSQVLLAPGIIAGGTVPYGYPEKEPIKQHWGEWTGRLGVDWKPELSFTDDTMLYAFYSRGYKGGGANPPQPGYAPLEDYYERQFDMFESPQWMIDFMTAIKALPILELTGVEYERTFEPEFVDAFEVGAKNTLLGGALTFNTGAFYYDYKDYQVSQIRDRTAVNENFDASIWGLEFETRFAPSRDFQLIANLGYLDTKIADGEYSIDIMDRTAGHPGFVVTKPWPQLPSNCIVPVEVVHSWMTLEIPINSYMRMCGGSRGALAFLTPPVIDPNTGEEYTPHYYNGENGTVDINGGAGIVKHLGGKELPNSPHWTMNIGAQYGMDILEDWRVTFRGDAYWQSQSWARVYNNDPYDKLHGWYNVNLSVWFERPEDDLKIEFYVKNALDKTPITDSFLNSDDTALTTNVFVLDPRLIGLSIRKGF